MKTLSPSRSSNSQREHSGDGYRSAYPPAATHEHPHLDPPEITCRIDEYRLRTVQYNAEQGMLPFFLATLSFAALLAYFVPHVGVLGWLAAVLSLAGLRLFLIAKYRGANRPSDSRWIRANVMVLVALGTLYGITPLWLELDSETWLLAVTNLWLAGLAGSVLLSQGIIIVAGLAFAVPAMTSLLCLLLFSGDSTQTIIALGNVILFTYFYAVTRRTHAAIVEQARHRMLFEQLAHHFDEQRKRSGTLVEELSAEIERRKKAEIALCEARDAAEIISRQDDLTSLSNRREFDRVLAQQWQCVLEAARPLSLMICNIDLFRSYNDHYGNLAGDQCLIKIARTIHNTINRPGALAARTSGEQVSVLLPDTTEGPRSISQNQFVKRYMI